MSRLYVFADEAGDYAFSRNSRASRYFILCTVTMEFCNQLSAGMLNLRREMIWAGDPVRHFFHCTEDKQVVRDKVYALLKVHPFEIQATIMEKAKAQPQTRASKYRFYQYAWYHHLKYAAPKFIRSATEIQITTATAGVKKEQPKFTSAVNDVAQQTMGKRRWKTAFFPSMADPVLQVADYCTWAIQKKWEGGNTRSYDLIKHRITHEVDMWERGTKLYY
jgi:Protein of unknown function (DUF3800)